MFILNVAVKLNPGLTYITIISTIVFCIYHSILLINIVNTCFVSIRLLLNDDKNEHMSKIILAFLIILMILGSCLVIFLVVVTFVPYPPLPQVGIRIGSHGILVKIVKSVFGPLIDMFSSLPGMEGMGNLSSLPSLPNLPGLPGLPGTGAASAAATNAASAASAATNATTAFAQRMGMGMK